MINLGRIARSLIRQHPGHAKHRRRCEYKLTYHACCANFSLRERRRNE
jgi:hypothetical protein